jgi:SAM-dependent methyltransferase
MHRHDALLIVIMDPYQSLQGFYSGFADRFDAFSSWDRRTRKERRFFKYTLDTHMVDTVLDCFCGTGFHIAMLSEMGYEIDGIDISPDMVRKAKENLNVKGLNADIRVHDVKALATEKKYDCVLSMGNSLPHEFGDKNLSKAMKNMYDALNPGGICIIHMENYDRLYEDRERFIPSVYRRGTDSGEVFIFAIDYSDAKVVFNILSIIEKAGTPKFNVDVVEYNPIWIKKLDSLILESGFREITLYEDFRMTPLGKDGTYDLIAVAKK